MNARSVGLPDPEAMIACPVCDTLHVAGDVPDGAQARCVRCGTVLMSPRRGAMTRILMLSVTAAILMIAAIFFPFLELSAAGFRRTSSVFDAVASFANGGMAPLSFAVAVLIIALPLLRLVAIAYAIGPMALGWYPAPHAERAFRWAEAVRPWAMAEVFIVGVGVALIKVAGLAKITLGPAFWAFAALVLVTVLKDSFMCRLTVWKTLEERRRS
ncbi:MAG: paraquat-inducible protein A [Rhodobacteraceae bacterium]|nr:paraquat-inducible protein A [Paracoccaceae bacterium]